MPIGVRGALDWYIFGRHEQSNLIDVFVTKVKGDNFHSKFECKSNVNNDEIDSKKTK